MKQLHSIITASFLFIAGASYSQSWQPVGTGMTGNSSGVQVRAFTEYAQELYVGGFFTNAGGISTQGLAKWNGSTWSKVGSGISGGMSAPYSPDATGLAIYNTDLYVCGNFAQAGGVTSNSIAKWNGSSWSMAAAAPFMGGQVDAVAVYNNELYVGGWFFQTSTGINYIAKWNGSAWTTVGSNGDMDDFVEALVVYKGELYAGGYFLNVDGNQISGLAKWNGTSWSAVGGGLFGTSFVYTLMVHNGELYVGGNLTVSGVNAYAIAKWDGTNWTALGTGMNNTVLALAGNNNDIYAGGHFTTAGGVSVNKIAKWDGTNWSALGSGMNASVWSLGTYKNELYAGGDFTQAGGVPASHIARWTGLTSINNAIAKENNIEIFPNPAGNYFSFIGGDDIKSIKIYNCLGSLVKEVSADELIGPDKQISLYGIVPGIYSVAFETKENKNIQEKLVILK